MALDQKRTARRIAVAVGTVLACSISSPAQRGARAHRKESLWGTDRNLTDFAEVLRARTRGCRCYRRVEEEILVHAPSRRHAAEVYSFVRQIEEPLTQPLGKT